jgi:hypothetical protein
MVINGFYNNKRNLRKCAKYMICNTHNTETSHHIWINEISDTNICHTTNEIKFDISKQLQPHFTDYNITNIPEIDEMYYCPSPHKVTHTDTSLVKPHYDSPLGGMYMEGVLFYRVMVACNKNDTVYTRFSNQISPVNIGEFHAFDYNNDLHSVEGAIPDGKHRLMLKLHYAIVPKSKKVKNIYELPSTHVNIMWTRIARYFMRAGSSPKNWIEFTYGPVTEYLMIANNFRMQFSTNHSLL